MSSSVVVWLIRHGETEWSLSGQHSGRTDLVLTARGEEEAREAGQLLASRPFDLVLCSPLQRARKTCEIAGYADVAVIDPDCAEWDYGDWSSLTLAQVREKIPGWDIWTGPVPNGESLAEIAARARRVVARIRESGSGTAAVFAHGHFLRIFATQWLGFPASAAANLTLHTAAISVLGYDSGFPAIRKWNIRASLSA